MDTNPKITPIYSIDPASIQDVAYTGTAEQSTAVGYEQVLLVASSACHVLFGSNPTATTAAFLLPANVFLAVSCQPTDLVSAVQDSAGGTLWIAGLK